MAEIYDLDSVVVKQEAEIILTCSQCSKNFESDLSFRDHINLHKA